MSPSARRPATCAGAASTSTHYPHQVGYARRRWTDLADRLDPSSRPSPSAPGCPCISGTDGLIDTNSTATSPGSSATRCTTADGPRYLDTPAIAAVIRSEVFCGFTRSGRAVITDIIARCHGRGNPDWPETTLQIVHAIGRYLRSYPECERAAAAGIACTIAVTRAAIHPDILLRLAPVFMSADHARHSAWAADCDHAVTDQNHSR